MHLSRVTALLMVRLFAFVIAFQVACVAFATSAVAGESDSEVSSDEAEIDEITDLDDAAEYSDDFGLAHRQRIYESSRLETRRALLYSAAFPGLGNFYAEQYALGTVSMMSMVFSGMFLAYGIRNNHRDLVGLGLVTTGLTYLGSGTAAYLGVRRYNLNLRRSLHIDDPHGALFSTHETGDHPLMLELQWRF